MWTLNYKVEGEKGTANVWLEEGGNMRPVTVKDQNGGSELEQVSTTAAPVLCAGRWSVQQVCLLSHFFILSCMHTQNFVICMQSLAHTLSRT